MEALKIELAPNARGLVNDQSLAGLQQMMDAHSGEWALTAYQVIDDEEMTVRMSFSLVDLVTDADEEED